MKQPASENHGIIDTHTHIGDAVFDADRHSVLERARAAGVGAVIAVAEHIADARKNLELAEQHPMIKAAAGLYPSCLDLEATAEMVDFIKRHRTSLVAIGEVGLDYWLAKEARERALQEEIFRSFILLSNELQLPLNVHSRSAGRHAVALLLKHNAAHVQLHAFDGKAGAALPAVEAGYYFSIPPSIVRSRQKQKLVRQLPLECLLLETDSPVLGPEAEARNEPANIRVAAQAIARIKDVTEDEVISVAGENTRRLYPGFGPSG